MSQYNKLSDIQYARFHILPMDLHFETVWSAGITTMYVGWFEIITTHIAKVEQLMCIVIDILNSELEMSSERQNKILQ